MAHALADATRRAGRVFIVNDDFYLARTVGADGVHLGPNDMAVDRVRALWPCPARIGASVRTVARARELVAAGADYLGVGPVFATSTKAGLPDPIGPEGIAAIAESVGVPVIGIGGISPSNAASVLYAGAAGIAVIGSIVGAVDEASATREMRRAIDVASLIDRG